MIVTDVLPSGLTYVNNSTSINNILAANNIATGLNIGNLFPGQEVIVKFYATANQVQSGQTVTVNNFAQVRADNLSTRNSLPVTVTISRSGVVLGAINVKTGASSALWMAGTISSLVTYGFYRRRYSMVLEA